MTAFAPNKTNSQFQLGQVIADKYELIRLVGEGAMGVVYEARHRVTMKRCAVKLVLDPNLAQNAEMIQRFFRESQASSLAESEHIVQVFDSGFDGPTDCPYMVMEFLAGEDLEDLMHRIGVFSPIAAAKLVLQAATGLAKAHEKRIVHRDVKPANLFLTQRESGELIVKVLDFGIAKVRMEGFAETVGGHGLTRTGSMLGTPLYMSPEQAKGAARVDPRADVWSLGMALYQFLSGRLPYVVPDSLGELMVNIITGDLAMLQDVAPWVAPELAEVAHRAISRDLDIRYQHAGELRDALAEIIPGGPRLTRDLLIAVPTELKNVIAPRLVLADDGMLRARTRTGLAVTNPPPTITPSRWPTFAIAGAAVAFVLGGGALLWSTLRPSPVESAAVVPSAELTTPTVASATNRSYLLPISPTDATVYVDGVETPLSDGAISVAGRPGETRTVSVKHGARERELIVVIAQTGLVPDEIKLAEPVASSKATVVAVRPPAATANGGGAKKIDPVPTATATTTGPKLVDDTSEFK